jgi:uncharacterized protein (TIGR00251 family)
MLQIAETKDGLIFKIAVQPRASRNQAAGRKGDALRVKLTAPPVDGAANKACLQLLAKTLGVPKSRLRIQSGERGRTKRILIRMDAPDGSPNDRQLRAKLLQLADA